VSGFTAISGVSRTLAAFITDATGVTVDADHSPLTVSAGAEPVINLYLYRVERSPFFVNNPMLRPDAATLQDPPLGLNLFYLITPYNNSSELQAQITLGEVLQVFNDTPIVPEAFLDPAVRDTTEELRIVDHPLSLDTMIDLWRSFEGRSYRLAATVEVSAVVIGSSRVRTVRRVEERHIEVEQLR
jgi:hypothetical protein